MKRFIIFLVLGLFFHPINAQVGIGTTDPQATLDVRGNLKVSTVPTSTTMTNYHVLAINDGTTEVTRVTPATLFTTLPTTTNTTVYAAKKTSGMSLLSLGLFPSGFRAVNFLAAERSLGAATLFSDTDNTYIIPSDGIYAVNFTFKYGTGLQASLLANSPGIGIVRTRAGVATTIDNRPFSGANLVLLSLTISETGISSIYSFQANDRISFGLTGSTALDVGLLGASTASFSIYKISN
ncbi:hypothetical protein [Chishuiella changwenlii]|uniref:hypothetical protein n=1 Tax=Chishuiella changwenlii TaxID=1434701 RepID=UPI002FDB1BA0